MEKLNLVNEIYKNNDFSGNINYDYDTLLFDKNFFLKFLDEFKIFFKILDNKLNKSQFGEDQKIMERIKYLFQEIEGVLVIDPFKNLMAKKNKK